MSLGFLDVVQKVKGSQFYKLGPLLLTYGVKFKTLE